MAKKLKQPICCIPIPSFQAIWMGLFVVLTGVTCHNLCTEPHMGSESGDSMEVMLVCGSLKLNTSALYQFICQMMKA